MWGHIMVAGATNCSTRWRRRATTTRGAFFPLCIAWVVRDLNRCSSHTRWTNRGLNDRSPCELDYIVVLFVLFQYYDLSRRT